MTIRSGLVFLLLALATGLWSAEAMVSVPMPLLPEAAPGAIVLGGSLQTGVRLRLNLPLLQRLVVAPEDLHELAIQLHVEVQDGVAGDSELLLRVDGAAPIRLRLTDALKDGWLTVPGLAGPARDWLRAGHSGGLVLEPGPGVPRLTCTGFIVAPAKAYVRAGNFWPTNQPRAVATVVEHPKAELFAGGPRWRDGVYCQVRDGHLTYGDDRLRLWGVCRAAAENPQQVERMTAVGFNAIRLWGPNGAYSPESAKRGAFEPAQLAGFDAYVAALKQHGMWIMMPGLVDDSCGIDSQREAVLADDSWLAGGDDWAAWKEAVRASHYNLRAFAYFDERLMRLRQRHAANLLDHRNLLTGRRYAEEESIVLWELANENGFAKYALEARTRSEWPEKMAVDEWPAYFRKAAERKWNAWLRTRYRDEAGLRAAWGALADGETLGTVHLAPVRAEQDRYPAVRGQDFCRFLITTIDAANQELRAFCRARAPAGTGVALVPFSFDTQCRRNLAWQYLNSCGDVDCFGEYIYRMDSGLARVPAIDKIDSLRVADQPTVLYEVNAGRPNPYRCEYPWQLAALGGWQDFDGIFWHYWQEPGADWSQRNAFEHYLVEDVYQKSDATTEDLWLDADPALGAALAAAGRCFLLGAVAPAPSPPTWTVGAQALFGFASFDGVDLAPATWRTGARVRFAPEQDVAVLPPEGLATLPPLTRAALRAGPQLLWDVPHGRLLVDAPACKSMVGVTGDDLRCADGVSLAVTDQPWAALAVVSLDGRPIVGADPARRLLVTAVRDAVNQGFVFDRALLGGGDFDCWGHLVPTILDRGHPPALVDRVSWRLVFPAAAHWRLVSYDFALRRRQERDFGVTTTIAHAADGDAFLTVLERQDL